MGLLLFEIASAQSGDGADPGHDPSTWGIILYIGGLHLAEASAENKVSDSLQSLGRLYV